MNKHFINFLTTSVIVLSCGTATNSSSCYCMESFQENSNTESNIKPSNINKLKLETNSNDQNNLDALDNDTKVVLDKINKELDSVLKAVLENNIGNLMLEKCMVRLRDCQDVCNSFSSAISTFVEYITDNNPSCKIFIPRKEYEEYFSDKKGNNSEKSLNNDQKVVNISDYLKVMVNNTVQKFQSSLNNEDTRALFSSCTKDGQFPMDVNSSYVKALRNELDSFNQYFSKMILDLKERVLSRIKDINTDAINKFDSLLNPVISKFEEVKFKRYVTKCVNNSYIPSRCKYKLGQEFRNWQYRFFDLLSFSVKIVEILDAICYGIDEGKAVPIIRYIDYYLKELLAIQRKEEAATAFDDYGKGAYEDYLEVDYRHQLRHLEYSGTSSYYTAPQKLEEKKVELEKANKLYKAAKQMKIKLSDVESQLTDNNKNTIIHLPSPKSEMTLPQLLRNFILIMCDSINDACDAIDAIDYKYGSVPDAEIQTEDVNLMIESMQYHFALLALPLSIIKNYLLNNLRNTLDDKNPYEKSCKEILEKELSHVFVKLKKEVSNWDKNIPFSHNIDELSSDDRCHKLICPILTCSTEESEESLENYLQWETIEGDYSVYWLVGWCKDYNASMVGDAIVDFATICNKIVSALFNGSQIHYKKNSYTKETNLLSDLCKSSVNLAVNAFEPKTDNESVRLFRKLIKENITVSSDFLKQFDSTITDKNFKLFDNPNYLTQDIHLVKFFKYLGNRILQLASNAVKTMEKNVDNKIREIIQTNSYLSDNEQNSDLSESDKKKLAYYLEVLFHKSISPFFTNLYKIKENLYVLSDNIEKYIKFPDNFQSANKNVLQQQLKSTANYINDVLINSGINKYEEYLKQKYPVPVKEK